MIAARRFPVVPAASFALVLLSIYAAAFALPRSQLFSRNPDLGALGITLDLILLVPLLYYLLLVRKTNLPAATVLPVFLFSLYGASVVLPRNYHTYLDIAHYLILPAELLVLSLIGIRVSRDVRRVRSWSTASGQERDILERLRQLLRSYLPIPLAANAVAHEIACLYYAFFAWRAKTDLEDGEQGFSYHVRNGYGGVLFAVMLVGTVEMGAVHFLVHRWSSAVAWALTAVSLYGLVWLLGHFQAIRLRPIRLTENSLDVRLGLLWNVQIPFASLVGVRPARGQARDRAAPGYLHAAPLRAATFYLELAEPVDVPGPYGYTRRNVRRIGIFVDDAAGFEQALEERIKKWRRTAINLRLVNWPAESLGS